MVRIFIYKDIMDKINDLKLIKKYYGENMEHFCRDNFATILEQEGKLFNIISSHFAYSKYLYDDLNDNCLLTIFKNYILFYFDPESIKLINKNKTPQELMSDAGYYLYECHSEKDIQSFKKYYKDDEELCTFKGGRLDKCYVFFAVKKDVDKIKREDFKEPRREDLYGTSVISIQFDRGDVNTLSIKNRYNHTIKKLNPDATFSNNLDNIVYGLTDSFAKAYNLNLKSDVSNIMLEDYDYVIVDGKYYKYNSKVNNVYYCPNNIIIDNGKVIDKYAKEKERYILIDYFIVDLKDKRIFLYDESIPDKCLVGHFDFFEKKNINDKNYKLIIKRNKTEEKIFCNRNNSIVKYRNDQIENVEDYFLAFCQNIEYVYLKNAKKIGNDFLSSSSIIQELDITNALSIGDNFLYKNSYLKLLHMLNVKYIGNNFLPYNEELVYDDFIDYSNVLKIGDNFLSYNEFIKAINLPNVLKIGKNFMYYNDMLSYINADKCEYIGDNFLYSNNSCIDYYLSNVNVIGNNFLYSNENFCTINFEHLKHIGDCFLNSCFHVEDINLPCVEHIGRDFICYADNLEEISRNIPNDVLYNKDFLNSNPNIRDLMDECDEDDYDNYSSDNAINEQFANKFLVMLNKNNK